MFQESRLYLNYLLQFKHFATYCCLSAMGTNKLNGIFGKKNIFTQVGTPGPTVPPLPAEYDHFLLEKPNQPYIKLICNL